MNKFQSVSALPSLCSELGRILGSPLTILLSHLSWVLGQVSLAGGQVVLNWSDGGVCSLPGFDCRTAQQRYIQVSTVNRRETIKCFFKNSCKMFRPCSLFPC